MAKKGFEYKVKVYVGDEVTTVTESSWTKGKRTVIRSCVIGEADKAVMPHRETGKSITCKKDSKGIYKAFIGDGKAVEAKLKVSGKIKVVGSSSLVKSAYNMLNYRLNELQGKGVKLEVVEL